MNKILTLSAAALALAVSGAAVAGKKTPAGPLTDPGGSITPAESIANALYASMGGGSPAFFQAVANAPGAVVDQVSGNAALPVEIGSDIYDVVVSPDGEIVSVKRRG